MGEAKRKERSERELKEARERRKKKIKLWIKRSPKALLAVLLMPIWLPIAIFIAVADEGKFPWES